MTTVQTKPNTNSASKVGYYCLLALIWGRYTLFSYIIQIIRRLPIIWMLADYIYPIFVILALLLAIPYIEKCLRRGDVIAFFVAIAILCLSLAFLDEDNVTHIKEKLTDILVFMALFFVGVCFQERETRNTLYLLSALGMIVSFLYQSYYIASDREVLNDDMGRAYNLLLSVMYLMYYAFVNRKVKYWLLPILGVILMLSFGTRGPILCIALFWMVGFYLTVLRSTPLHYKLIAMVVVALVVSVVFFTNLIGWMSQIFEKMGFSTRIFDYFQAGNITNDTGRDALQGTVWEALLKKPFTGYGLMGDRVLLKGIYVHNIFLEILCHFGFIVGTALIIGLIILLVKGVKGSQNLPELLFIIMMIIAVIVKLILSNSYLIERWFFFLLGVCVCYSREKKEKNDVSDEKDDQKSVLSSQI